MGLSTLQRQSWFIWKMVGVSAGIHALALLCVAGWLTIRPSHDRIVMVSLQVTPTLPATQALFTASRRAQKHPKGVREIQSVPHVAKSLNRAFNSDPPIHPLPPSEVKKEEGEKYKVTSPREWVLSEVIRKQKHITPHKYGNSRLPYLPEVVVIKAADASLLALNKQVQTDRPSVSLMHHYPRGRNPNKNQSLVRSRPIASAKSKSQMYKRKSSTKTNLGITTNTFPWNLAKKPESARPSQIRFLSQKSPAYPLISRERGEEGVVTLRIEILTTGQVGQVKIVKSSGHKLLDHAALKSAATWRFGFSKEKPNHSSWARVPIRFRLAN